jgi:myosin V
MTEQDDIDNLLNLSIATQENILTVLKKRYEKNKIYTNSGNLLLAVNPYQELHELFTEEIFQIYTYQDKQNLSSSSTPHAPHPWLIASLAYQNLCSPSGVGVGGGVKVRQNQSILISGESGAGKTETTKILMSYLARRGTTSSLPSSSSTLSRSSSRNFSRGLSRGLSHGNLSMKNLLLSSSSSTLSPPPPPPLGLVQKKVLQTNPILDALGNSKTVRNDNSSRFGKYIKLLYNPLTGELLGSSLETFLLEATRVVHHQSGERNFHIFYMVTSIATDNTDTSRAGVRNQESGDESEGGSGGEGVGVSTREKMREKYKIQPWHSYAYLLGNALQTSGGTKGQPSSSPSSSRSSERRDGVKDSDLYRQFRQAFAILEAGGGHQNEDGGHSNTTNTHNNDADPTLPSIPSTLSSSEDGNENLLMDGLLRAVMSVLTIGNTHFTTYLNSSGDTIMNLSNENMKYIHDTAHLLSLDSSFFFHILTTKTVKINGEEYLSTLDEIQATQMRDVFAKTLYRTLFEFVIQHLNYVLRNEINLSDRGDNITRLEEDATHHLPCTASDQLLVPPAAPAAAPAASLPLTSPEVGIIGILDIFGFEIFEMNSLEQLLINYCNEHLQQQYDQVMIEKEQLLYVHEGIHWDFISFPSSHDTIALISGLGTGTSTGNRNGTGIESGSGTGAGSGSGGTKMKIKPDFSILGFLDEACIVPSGSDNSFMRQVYTNLETHSCLSLTSLNKAKNEFGIKHYAGVVVYSAKDFVMKNKTLFFPLDQLLKTSGHGFFQQLEQIAANMISSKGLTRPPPLTPH